MATYNETDGESGDGVNGNSTVVNTSENAWVYPGAGTTGHNSGQPVRPGGRDGQSSGFGGYQSAGRAEISERSRPRNPCGGAEGFGANQAPGSATPKRGGKRAKNEAQRHRNGETRAARRAFRGAALVDEPHQPSNSARSASHRAQNSLNGGGAANPLVLVPALETLPPIPGDLYGPLAPNSAELFAGMGGMAGNHGMDISLDMSPASEDEYAAMHRRERQMEHHLEQIFNLNIRGARH